MAEITAVEIRAFLKTIQGREISLKDIRAEFNILSGTKSFDGVRNIMFQLAEQRIVKPSGKKNGIYKVVSEVKPVQVFGIDRERRPPFSLIFPKDFDTGREMSFSEDVVLREGDLILISGLSNYGKTALAMNFCGENIDQHPVLMGNEYTTVDGEPSQRFLSRLDNMNWVKWVNGDGQDKFTLLPVHDDYAEHIIKNRINIVDWIDIESGEYFMISPLLKGIKREVGKGIAIATIQKAQGAESGRGGQMTKDFADCELLIDKYSDSEILLTIGKVKEYKNRLLGKTYAYGITEGVKIINFREVVKCHACFGKKWVKAGNSSKPCDICGQIGYIDKHIIKDEDLF